jgi:hypothetical protein
MESHLHASVARTIAEDRQRVLRGHAVHQPAVARPGPASGMRRSAAHAVARVARRLDADTARRVTAA